MNQPQDDHYQKQMTKSYISCYNNKTKELESFMVTFTIHKEQLQTPK